MHAALVLSSVSSRAVRQARHSQNARARHVERVESCRVETWRAKCMEYGLIPDSNNSPVAIYHRRANEVGYTVSHSEVECIVMRRLMCHSLHPCTRFYLVQKDPL